MKTYELAIYIVGPDGAAHQQGGSISITASDVEAAEAKAREQLSKRQLPPTRSLNFTPDGKIVVYCAERPPRLEKADERVVWKRPLGEKRL